MGELGTLIYFGLAPRGNGKAFGGFLCNWYMANFCFENITLNFMWKTIGGGEKSKWGRPVRRMLQSSQGKKSAEISEKVIQMMSIRYICELLKNNCGMI